MPIFIGLFRLLDLASKQGEGRGLLTDTQAQQLADAELFGAPISATLKDANGDMHVMILAGVLVLAMTLTMFLTQRQLMKKGMPQSALEGPFAQQQKIMMILLPIGFLISGVFFPIGVLLYWTTSNLWTMGQQFYVIRNNPAPGSEGFKAKQLRDEAKRKRKGKLPIDESGNVVDTSAPPEPPKPPTAPATEEADPFPAQEVRRQAGQQQAQRPGQTQERHTHRYPRDSPSDTPGYRPDDSPSSKGDEQVSDPVNETRQIDTDTDTQTENPARRAPVEECREPGREVDIRGGRSRRRRVWTATRGADDEESVRPGRRERLEQEGDIAADYLEELLEISDLDGDLDMDVEGDRATVSIVGADLPQLVGDQGEVLEALQELTRLAVYRETGERSRLMLDVSGHRAERRTALEEQASRIVAQVKESGERATLEPMSPFERKVVHDVVAAAGLTSESEGTEPRRFVVVLPE